MKKSLIALVACVGVAASANAQSGYEVAFANDTVVLTQDDFAGGSVTVDCEILIGWFGEGGLGPRSFLGSINSDEGDMTLGGATGPEFSDGPTSGMGSDAQNLNNVDWFRGGVLDPTGTNPPPAHGVDELVSVGSFSIEISDPTEREFTITATSTSANIESWNFVPFAFSWFVGNSGAPQTASATKTIRIVPAPGAAALLGLGGLAAIRRRR